MLNHATAVIVVFTGLAAFAMILLFLLQPRSTPLSATHSCGEPPTRREWRSLNKREQEEYLSAVKCLYSTKSELVSTGSIIDDFTWVHIRAAKTGN